MTREYTANTVYETKEIFNYNELHILKEKSRFDSNDYLIVEKSYYPHDLNNTNPLMQELVDQNRLDLIKSEIYFNNSKVESQNIEYKYFDDLLLPSAVWSSKGEEPLELRLKYNNRGNVQELKTPHG